MAEPIITDPAAEDAMLQQLLDFDPLGAAEEVRGTSYKEDQGTMALGFALLQNTHQMRAEVLAARGDTTFYNHLDRYIEIIEGDGFEQVFQLPFIGRSGEPNQFFIFWHARDNILLAFDTYRTTEVNGGTMYYNWVPKSYYEPNEYWTAVSSGHFDHYDDEERRVWVGSHDCREALLFNLDKLRRYGNFVSPWRGNPRLWLTCHGDHDAIGDDPDHSKGIEHSKSLTRLRVAMLPLPVLEAISHCGECGNYSETVKARSCSFRDEVSGRLWSEVVCDDCEAEHIRDI